MLIDDSDKFEWFMNVLERSHPVFICDLETTGLDPWHGDRLVGLAFSFMEKGDWEKIIESFYLPFRHEGFKNLPYHLLQCLFPLFSDPRRTWMNTNTRFDMHTLQQEGVTIQNAMVDLIQVTHLANE